MHAMLSNDYTRKVCCMAAGAPAAFCRTSRRGFASPQSARSSHYYCYLIIRNAEASLGEIESRDRHYKRTLLLLRTHW